MTLTNRNNNYDFLRFIGISCIILAHMEPPTILFQLRNFDVPLMVLISGISFDQFSSKSYSSYFNYFYTRFIRLVLPTWLFLLFFDFCLYLAGNDLPNLHDFLLQISLTGGTEVGIFIIRIFVIMALIAPLLDRINKGIKNNKIFYLIIALTYVAYEICCLIASIYLKEDALFLVSLSVFEPLAYGLVFLYGLRISSFKSREILSQLAAIFAIFTLYLIVGFLVCGKIVTTQPFKYPPTIYYLSYSIIISQFLFYAVTFHNIRAQDLKLVQFIGKSTLWIYLWHWFFIRTYDFFSFNQFFIIKYIAVYLSATLLVYGQTETIKFIIRRYSLSKKQGGFLTKVFTG